VRDDIDKVVESASHREVKAPASVDPSLPDGSCLAVFLSAEGKMVKISEQMSYLFGRGTLKAPSAREQRGL